MILNVGRKMMVFNYNRVKNILDNFYHDCQSYKKEFAIKHNF